MNRKLLVALPVAGVAVAGAAVAARKAMDAGPLPQPPGLVREIGGEQIHYIDEGSGPAIVLVHGFAGHTFSWREVIPLLTPAFRVVAVDLPGFGYSDRDPERPLSHDEHAERLVRLLDTLGIERATLVGHSMGGGVVTRAAVAHPERVERLVLVASVDPAEPMRWQHGQPGASIRAMSAGMSLLAAFPPLATYFIGKGLRGMAYDPATVTPEVVRGYVRPLLIPGTVRCLARMMRETEHQEVVDLAKVAMPVLVVSGEQDPAFNVAVGERIAAAIPGARQVVLEQCGHMAPEERADALVEELLTFLHEAVPA
ncbi:MAG: alpha/beta hydrolase [Dehalococcoidia bacterium]|nr:alpha/beta hydrolase [Dehalococcoidia bacterium]